MPRTTLVVLFCWVLFAIAGLPSHATSVLTYRYDNQRDGVDSTETTLMPSNLTTSTFAKLYTTNVDGGVYAEPLYVPNVTVTGGEAPGAHNLVIVATQNDSLYAIDANSGAVVWHDSFLALNLGVTGATTITAVPSADVDSTDTAPEIGICSTPVIDSSTNMLFVEAKTKQIINGNTSTPHYVHTLYQIDLTNGNATPNANIVNSAIFADTGYDGTYYYFRTDPDPTATDQDPFVVGSAPQDFITVNFQSRVYFNGLRQMNRPGLMLLNGVIYIAFASHGDNTPYHGWLLGFNESTLALTAVFNTTPNGGLGGIWSAGGGLTCDAAGNIYVMTGNGTFDGDNSSGSVTGLNGNNQPASGDYGDCFIKLTVDGTTSQGNQNINGWGLTVADYFAPYNNQDLSSNDSDVGSGGCLILPDAVGSGTHQQLMIGGGKQGILYLIDRNAMGEYGTSDNVVQEETLSGGSFNTPAIFNNTIYTAAMSDHGRAFPISSANLSNPTTTPDTFAWPGSSPTVSVNGTSNEIVWMLDHGTNQLRAYSPNLTTEYWTSAMASGSRDAVGSVEKFAAPTVADGRVFIGTTGTLVGYGPITAAPPTPPVASTSTASAITATSVTLGGTVNPKGTATTASFNYGTTSSYGTLSNTFNAGSGNANASYTISLTNLTPGTTYYYQAYATNGSTGAGTARTFKTLATPNISNTATSYLSATGTELAVTVNPDGVGTSVYIQYGTDATYSLGVTPTQSIGAGTSNVTTNVILPSLPAGQTFHYRIVSASAAGTFYGQDQTFTTLGFDTTLMAAKNDAVPGFSGATFNTFNNPIINASAYVAFKATLNNGIGGITAGSNTGIWADDHTGTLQLVAQINGANAPGPSNQFSALSDPVYNDNEAVAFCGTVRPGNGITNAMANGVWCNSTGSLSLVAQQGTAAPGVAGGTFASFSQIVLPNQGGATNQGGVIMLATLNTNGSAGINGNTNLGIWGVDSTGTLDLIVRTGDVVNGRTITGIAFLPTMSTSVAGQGRNVSQATGNLVYLATFSDRSTAIITVSF